MHERDIVLCNEDGLSIFIANIEAEQLMYHRILAHDPNYLIVFPGAKSQATLCDGCSQRGHTKPHAVQKSTECPPLSCVCIDVQRVVLPLCLIWAIEEEMLNILLWYPGDIWKRGFNVHDGYLRKSDMTQD